MENSAVVTEIVLSPFESSAHNAVTTGEGAKHKRIVPT
jgi:hypothetical protein